MTLVKNFLNRLQSAIDTVLDQQIIHVIAHTITKADDFNGVFISIVDSVLPMFSLDANH